MTVGQVATASPAIAHTSAILGSPTTTHAATPDAATQPHVRSARAGGQRNSSDRVAPSRTKPADAAAEIEGIAAAHSCVATWAAAAIAGTLNHRIQVTGWGRNDPLHAARTARAWKGTASSVDAATARSDMAGNTSTPRGCGHLAGR